MPDPTLKTSPKFARPRGAKAIVVSRAQRRYQIWARQAANGQTPCFGTPTRYFCDDWDCPFRAECLQLRAAWRR